MIDSKGPCTPYALRREFMDSPSQYWSASSGAVYPLVVRLARRGFIRVKSKTDDKREGNRYVLTAAGLRALKTWVDELSSVPCVSVPPDPLRNRVAFLELLEPKDRPALVQDALENLRNHLNHVTSYTAMTKREQSTCEYLVSLGAQRMLEARLGWLEEVAVTLGKNAV